MHQEQRQRARDLLKAKGIDRALFANFNSVKWLTGFTPTLQTGPNPFAGGPPLVWYEDGHFTLIVVDSFAAAAEAFGREPDGALITYLGYTIEQPIAGPSRLSEAFQDILAQSGQRSGIVGVEEADVTILLDKLLQDAFAGEVAFEAIDGWLTPLRMVKTDEELVKLRENFALTDVGHAAARREVTAGKREIDIWAAMHSAIQQQAGRRVPFGNDCVVGHRPENNVGGWPLDYEIKPDGSLIVDLSTILHGYWSDSCATYYPNEPTQKQKQMHRTVEEALEFAISLIKPGAIAKDIDQKVRQFIANAGYPVYPHHTGHGVGVSGHEAPRIVPYSNEILEAGMVIMLEPGIYFPGETGVRLEDGLLVTSDGVEILTGHDKSMP